MAITALLASMPTTATGAANYQSNAISGITTPWTLVLEISELSSTGNARFGFADSVNAFSAEVAGPSVSVTGQISSGTVYVEGVVANAVSTTRRFTFKQQDYPDLRFGVSSAVLRLELTRLTAASVTFQAWVEY